MQPAGIRHSFAIPGVFQVEMVRWARYYLRQLPYSRKLAHRKTTRSLAHLACVFILLEPAQRASATITCLQAMFVGCAAATLLRPGTKESASRGCEGGLTGRCGHSVEFLTRLLCVAHPHCAVVPVLRNALQTTAWLPYYSTYWIIPVWRICTTGLSAGNTRPTCTLQRKVHSLHFPRNRAKTRTTIRSHFAGGLQGCSRLPRRAPASGELVARELCKFRLCHDQNLHF